MADYKLRPRGVIRNSDRAMIPDDPRNRDWRRYQAWLNVPGNTPDPADPPYVKLDTDAEMASQLAAANTVAQLKAALLGSGTRKARIVSKPTS